MKIISAILPAFLAVNAKQLRSASISKEEALVLYGAVPSSSIQNNGHYKEKKVESPPVDPLRLFEILSSKNDIIVGNLPEAIPYSMPNNVKMCQDSFDIEERSAEFLTNPPPAFPEYNSKDGSYSYVQYKEDSYFGRSLQTVIDRTDDLMEQLYQAGMMSAMDTPALMFDIDNTMEYTAYNDTDFVGEGPPLTPTVNFIKKWCIGWGSGDRAMMQCIFITARYCTELNAKATSTWLKTTYDASDELISTHVQFSGNLKCSCCGDGSDENLAYKDILRKEWKINFGFSWVASIGDQFTDSVGHYSGIKIKLPNVWFDSSKVPNQYTMGTVPQLDSDGLIPEGEWNTQCKVRPQAPIAPGPRHCLNDDALRRARHYASFEYCLAQTDDKVPNQVWGCDADISTGHIQCN